MQEDPPRPSPPEPPLPDHVALTHDGANLVLEVRWSRVYQPLFLLIAIFWDGGLVYLLASHTDPNMLGFPTLYVGIGVALTYYVIAGFVNRTRVTVGGGAVDVRIGPLPWAGSKRVEARDIEQVYCQVYIARSRGGTEFYSYSVDAITPQNRKLTLVSELDDRDVALYLEQEIENALGITNEYVPGQLRK